MAKRKRSDEAEATDARPALTPAQYESVVAKVAHAMAVAHFGEGADGAGYMQDARSFVGAALALEQAVAEAQEEPEAPVDDGEAENPSNPDDPKGSDPNAGKSS